MPERHVKFIRRFSKNSDGFVEERLYGSRILGIINWERMIEVVW